MMEVSNLGDPKDATAAALAEGACIMTEVEGPAPVRSPLNKTVARLGKAVRLNGRSYDVGVRLASTNEAILLVENFEDVEPPEMLRQACEEKAQCPGYIEELSTGLHWPSSFPLERKGWYVFTPRPSLQGIEAVLDNFLKFMARILKAPAGPASKGD